MHITSRAYNAHSYGVTNNSLNDKVRLKQNHLDKQDSLNYRSDNNEVFRNILNDSISKGSVSVEDESLYYKGDLSSSSEVLSYLIIKEKNGEYEKAIGAVPRYSVSDLKKFRELTGYNLVQAAGMVTVADDYGNPPLEKDQVIIQAAWNMFDLAKGAQDRGSLDSDLTWDELITSADGLRKQIGANIFIFDLLIDLIKSK